MTHASTSPSAPVSGPERAAALAAAVAATGRRGSTASLNGSPNMGRRGSTSSINGSPNSPRAKPATPPMTSAKAVATPFATGGMVAAAPTALAAPVVAPALATASPRNSFSGASGPNMAPRGSVSSVRAGPAAALGEPASGYNAGARRRSSACSTASLSALAAAATYSRDELYNFLLVSKELGAAADFIVSLMQLGGLNDATTLTEMKTILVDAMADRFADTWDIRQPKRGAAARTIHHAPVDLTRGASAPDALLKRAFDKCNLAVQHLPTLLPVAFTMTVNPGSVAYTTSDVPDFAPVTLFEARPYLPPRHLEPVDHGADVRSRAIQAIKYQDPKALQAFDVDAYFGGAHSAHPGGRRPSVLLAQAQAGAMPTVPEAATAN